MELGAVFTFVVGAPAKVHQVAAALTRHAVDGATIVPAVGLWRGAREDSVLVKIAGLSPFQAQRIALVLASEFDQEAIYVEHDSRAWLVSRAQAAATEEAAA